MVTVDVNPDDKVRFLNVDGSVGSVFDYDAGGGVLELVDESGSPADQRVGALEADQTTTGMATIDGGQLTVSESGSDRIVADSRIDIGGETNNQGIKLLADSGSTGYQILGWNPTQTLRIYDGANNLVMELDKSGNLSIAGSLTENANL